MNPGRGGWRLARGCLLALASTIVAAVVHAAAGGGVAPVGALALVTVGIGGAFVRLADRRRGLVGLTAAALGAQAAFHLAFSCSMAHPSMSGSPMAGSPMAGAGMGGSGMAGSTMASSAPFWQMLPDPAMVAGHVLGALVTAWLAWRGETTLWALYGLLLFAVGVPRLVPGRMPEVPRPVAPDTTHLTRRRFLLDRAHPLRGPPARFA